MTKHAWLLRFPRLYAWFALRRRAVNYEKILYLLSIKRGEVVFDIGANWGYFTFLFSKLTGPKGCVHCFEPVPITYEKLLSNMQYCKNIKFNNIAVGEKRKMARISYDTSDLEKASLLSFPKSNDSFANVEVIPLDDYVAETEISRLDSIKCDVEGYELHALRGMEQTLCRFHPKLTLEVTLPMGERQALLIFLKEIGYDHFRKVEVGFPVYEPESKNHLEDYFYLHAFSSKASVLSS